MTEMLPCPNPDCPYPAFHLGTYDPTEGRCEGYRCQGICPCGARGPCEDADTDDEAMELAILAWNALPRPFVWSSEPPKVPGDYRSRWPGDPKGAIFHYTAEQIADPDADWGVDEGTQYCYIPEPGEPEGGE